MATVLASPRLAASLSVPGLRLSSPAGRMFLCGGRGRRGVDHRVDAAPPPDGLVGELRGGVAAFGRRDAF